MLIINIFLFQNVSFMNALKILKLRTLKYFVIFKLSIWRGDGVCP